MSQYNVAQDATEYDRYNNFFFDVTFQTVAKETSLLTFYRKCLSSRADYEEI